MLRDPVEKVVQSFPPDLDEVIVEAFHHAFHYKLFRERLKTKQQNTKKLTTQTSKHVKLESTI